MPDRAAELGATLQNAAAVPAILEALARAVWFNAHAGAECPPERIPTPEALAEWLPECPDAAREAAELASDAWQILREQGAARSDSGALLFTLLGFKVPLGVVTVAAVKLGISSLRPDDARLLVLALHLVWLDGREYAGTLRHPLAPLVADWQARALPATWDARQHRNLPAPLTRTVHAVPAPDDRPGADHLPFDWAALNAQPGPPAAAPRFEVAYLPTLDPDAESLLPLAMLELFTAAAARGSGGPVPVPARIGWEVVLALDATARTGGAARLDCTLDDLHRMVYPATSRWDRRKGPRLVRGLFNLDAARVRWRGDETGGLYPLVEVYRLPTRTAPDEPVLFLSHLPPGSPQGPQADSLLLRHLAAASARQHRMMLAAYCLFDTCGTAKGRLIAPTLPEVRRDPAGYVVDARGRVATEKGGAPTRRATHPLAVQTGERERNPAADRYRWIAGRDLILLGYPFVAATAAVRRDQRRRVLEAAKELRARGALDFEEEYRNVRGGRELVALRLLPSAGHVAAHAARWAARKHDRRGAGR